MREAARHGLDMVAICDHNSAGNVRPSVKAGGGVITVIAGIEVTTAEEVHVLGLFPTPEAAEEVAAVVREGLPDRPRARPEEQILFGDDDEPVGSEARPLVASCGLTLAVAVDLIRSRGGLVVGAHVDRPSFGVLGQLGFIPEDVRFDAVEISTAGLRAGRCSELARLGLPIVSSSDAHSPEEIAASVTELDVEEASFEELRAALSGLQGRRCRCA